MTLSLSSRCPIPAPPLARLCHCLAVAVCALALLATSAAAATPATRGGRFALIVTIGNYAGGLPRLPGAQRDLEHARAVAKAAGVPDDNVFALHDREAGAESIRRALTDLALRLAPADRVMLYFSGLGSRRQDLDRPGGCEEVFLAADGEALGYGELAGFILPVAEKAEKTMVFFDACGTAQRGGGLTARCVPPDAGSDCRVTASTRWRNLTADVRKAAVPTANIVAVHAGRPDETVFDDNSGGIFSLAVNHCGLADAADQDQSGAISLAEISACAQQAIDRRVGGAGKGGQITMNGNQGFVPFMLRGGGQGPVGRLFEDLVWGRDGRKDMVLENMRAPAGVDGPSISLRAAGVGYLYLIAADGDGAARLVYPAAADGSNRLRSGETFVFPRSGRSPLAAGVPVVAILADNERDLALLPAAPGASFAATSAARRALYDFATTSIRAGEAPCQASGRQRNVSLWRGCSDAYGAAVIVVTPK